MYSASQQDRMCIGCLAQLFLIIVDRGSLCGKHDNTRGGDKGWPCIVEGCPSKCKTNTPLGYIVYIQEASSGPAPSPLSLYPSYLSLSSHPLSPPPPPPLSSITMTQIRPPSHRKQQQQAYYNIATNPPHTHTHTYTHPTCICTCVHAYLQCICTQDTHSRFH